MWEMGVGAKIGREERDREELDWMMRQRQPGLGLDIGFARKGGGRRGSRGINAEALDMAMVAIRKLQASYFLPNFDVFVRGAGGGMIRRFCFKWWERL